MDDRRPDRVPDDAVVATRRDGARGTVSVVVSRRVADGAEDAFLGWAARITMEVARQPGFLGTELQRPEEAHPDAWVTVYRFATMAQLEAWRASEERAALLREVAPLLEGSSTEQVVAEPVQGDRPVTVVMTQRVRPGREQDFENAHAQVTTLLSTFPGFLRCELIPPVDDVSDEYVLAFAFDTRAHLDRWLQSGERRSWLTEIASLIEGDRRMNVVGGFAGWFPATSDTQPPKWKQASAVLLALFPTTLILTVARQALLPDLPLVPSVLLSNVLGVATLTWLLMPWVTRVLEPWLQG